MLASATVSIQDVFVCQNDYTATYSAGLGTWAVVGDVSCVDASSPQAWAVTGDPCVWTRRTVTPRP